MVETPKVRPSIAEAARALAAEPVDLNDVNGCIDMLWRVYKMPAERVMAEAHQIIALAKSIRRPPERHWPTGQTLWVTVDGICRLRVSAIGKLVVDGRAPTSAAP